MDIQLSTKCSTQQMDISNELISILMATSDDIVYPGQLIAINKEYWKSNGQHVRSDLIAPIVSMFELLVQLKGRDLSAMKKFLRSYTSILGWRHEVLKVNAKSIEKVKYNDNNTAMKVMLEENRCCVKSEENMIALLADELCQETSHIYKRMCTAELKVKFSLLRFAKYIYKLSKNHSLPCSGLCHHTFKPVSYYWQEDIDNTWNSLEENTSLKNHQLVNNNLQSNPNHFSVDKNDFGGLIGVSNDFVAHQDFNNHHENDNQSSVSTTEHDFKDVCQIMEGHSVAISSCYKEMINKNKTLSDSKLQLQQVQSNRTDQNEGRAEIVDGATSAKSDTDDRINNLWEEKQALKHYLEDLCRLSRESHLSIVATSDGCSGIVSYCPHSSHGWQKMFRYLLYRDIWMVCSLNEKALILYKDMTRNEFIWRLPFRFIANVALAKKQRNKKAFFIQHLQCKITLKTRSKDCAALWVYVITWSMNQTSHTRHPSSADTVNSKHQLH